VFALLLSTTRYSSILCLLVSLGLIPFFPVTVYLARILIVPGIAAFARKMTKRNREKMK
jgi:type III secretory pathway component EscV